MRQVAAFSMLLACGVCAGDRDVAPPDTGVLSLVADEPRGGGSSGQRDSARTVTDVDGNVYRTVTIGNQVWMSDNLRVGHYRDGTTIPLVSDTAEWGSLTTGASCLPEHDPRALSDSYGRLYNFHATQDGRGLCPAGWHVPTAAEWRTLIERLGGTEVAGGRMKDTSTGLWRISPPGSTNDSGFSAVPAGGRGQSGDAAEVGYYATWWSSTPYDSAYAWHWGLHPNSHGIRFNPGHQSSGFSVRCIRD